jgi:hypothetical protein
MASESIFPDNHMIVQHIGNQVCALLAENLKASNQRITREFYNFMLDNLEIWTKHFLKEKTPLNNIAENILINIYKVYYNRNISR